MIITFRTANRTEHNVVQVWFKGTTLCYIIKDDSHVYTAKLSEVDLISKEGDIR